MNKHSKIAALNKARLLYFQHSEGLSDVELAAHLRVSTSTANRYRLQLGGGKITAFGKYTLEPNADDIALAEAILRRRD